MVCKDSYCTLQRFCKNFPYKLTDQKIKPIASSISLPSNNGKTPSYAPHLRKHPIHRGIYERSRLTRVLQHTAEQKSTWKDTTASITPTMRQAENMSFEICDCPFNIWTRCRPLTDRLDDANDSRKNEVAEGVLRPEVWQAWLGDLISAIPRKCRLSEDITAHFSKSDKKAMISFHSPALTFRPLRYT